MRSSNVVCLAALGGLLFGAGSCDDDEDPVARTDTIVIQLAGIKEGDIHDGVVEKDKNVTTEVGNPYGAFLDAARVALGRNPSRIEVTSVAITLGGDSRGVISFADLFVGETNVFLRADVGGTVYVARVTGPTGVGPVICEVIAGDSALAPIRDALLAGNFRVGIRGTTNRLPTDDFDARIDVRIGFAAYP
mgnify:CR=1 FL=1